MNERIIQMLKGEGLVSPSGADMLRMAYGLPTPPPTDAELGSALRRVLAHLAAVDDQIIISVDDDNLLDLKLLKSNAPPETILEDCAELIALMRGTR